MTGAFVYLVYHSWLNRFKMRLSRLRQPKYLFGAIVGVLWIYGYFYQFLFKHLMGGGGPISPADLAWREPLQAFFLFVAVLFLAWVLPQERGMVFSEAEVAFLFPAPLSRKGLVHYKLLKSQISIVFTVLFFSVIWGTFGLGKVGVFRVAGWWIILSVLNLHLIGASLTREILFGHGISSWKRRSLVLVVLGVMFAWVAIWAYQTIPPPPEVTRYSDFADFRYYLQKLAEAGPAHYILYPFRLVVRPRLQADWPAFLQAVWPALLILLAHYFWVNWSDVAFEESSADFSRKLAERMANLRANRGQWQFKAKKKKPAPFVLRPGGIPSVGFLWKNLIGAGHLLSARLLIILMACIVPAAIVFATQKQGGAISSLGVFSVMLLYMSYLVGPQFLRQDFRQDIPMADLLKSYPMTGLQIALGELLTPATLLTCLQWLLIILCMGTTGRLLGNGVSLELRLGVGSGMAILAPGLNLVLLIIPNAAVLLFPGWFQTGRTAPQGIEAMGQRLIFSFGQIFVLLLALVPAAAAFAGVYFVTQFFTGPYLAIPSGAIGALIVLATEGFLGLLWLGRLFEKFDVATEGASQA